MLKRNKGVAIEYALLLMVIITAFLVTLFTTIQLYIDRSDKYSAYVDRKVFLDRIGDAIIENRVKGATNDINSMMQDNKFRLSYNDYSSYVLITRDSKVMLMITFGTEGGKTVVKSYTYGIKNV